MTSAAPRTSGIYAIQRGQHTYIGSSADIKKRWSNHRSELRRGVHPSPHLQNAWNLYGEDSFEFSIVEECPIDQLLAREQWHLDQCNEVYNCAPIAGTRRGVPHSPETRERMSAAHMGHEMSPEAREKLRSTLTGRKLSPEHRANMSAVRIGSKHTDETRAKMSVSQTGRKHTEESKAKMSAVHKARWERKHSEEATSKSEADQ